MSSYEKAADGGVIYTGDPALFSQAAADAVARGLELGSEPAPTGDPDEAEVTGIQKASERASRRPGPDLEKGTQV